MNRKYSILLIEDDADLNEIISASLLRNGYTCTRAYSGTEARLLLSQQKSSVTFDLVITELMLPGLSGRIVIKLIRQRTVIPIIVISALESSSEKLQLFEMGIDDYLAKPFDLDELNARIAVQLRHAATNSHERIDEPSEVLVYRSWMLDPNSCVFSVADKPEKLTPTEFRIMATLMSQPHKVFTKKELYGAAWQEECFIDENAINVHISNIRSKLKPSGTDSYIKTVWGIGIKLIDSAADVIGHEP